METIGSRNSVWTLMNLRPKIETHKTADRSQSRIELAVELDIFQETFYLINGDHICWSDFETVTFCPFLGNLIRKASALNPPIF